MQILFKSKGPVDFHNKILNECNIKYDNEENSIEKTYLNRILDRIGQRDESEELDLFFGKGCDRVTFKLDSKDIKTDDVISSIEYSIIEKELNRYGYTMQDYILGTCLKEGRIFKIGKVLSKHESPQLKRFTNSSLREGYKKELVATVSRNDYDVLTMSTFRGWRSCMNLIDGEYTEHLPYDIKNNTLIIYLHDESDIEIKKPSARLLLKPFKDDDTNTDIVRYFSEGVTYGTTTYDLLSIGKAICEEINSCYKEQEENSIVKLSIFKGLYVDSQEEHIIKNRPWNLENDDDIKIFNWDDVDTNESISLHAFLNQNKFNPRYFNSMFVRHIDYEFTEEFIKSIEEKSTSVDEIFFNIRHILYSEYKTKFTNQEFQNILKLNNSNSFFRKELLLKLYNKTIDPVVDLNGEYGYLVKINNLINGYDGNIDVDSEIQSYIIKMAPPINNGSNLHKFIINNLNLSYNYYYSYVITLFTDKTHLETSFKMLNEKMLSYLIRHHLEWFIMDIEYFTPLMNKIVELNLKVDLYYMKKRLENCNQEKVIEYFNTQSDIMKNKNRVAIA